MTELSSKIDVERERELHAKHIRGSACESFQMLLRGFEMTCYLTKCEIDLPDSHPGLPSPSLRLFAWRLPLPRLTCVR